MNPRSRNIMKGDGLTLKKISILKYLYSELIAVEGCDKTNNDFNQKDNTRNFFHVPLLLEQYIFLGCWICLDAFLYMFTYFPIRVVAGLAYFGWRLLLLQLPRSTLTGNVAGNRSLTGVFVQGSQGSSLRFNAWLYDCYLHSNLESD